MASAGRCPKCERTVAELVLDKGEVAGSSYLAVTFLCPHCRTILGAGFDLEGIKEDIIKYIRYGDNYSEQTSG